MHPVREMGHSHSDAMKVVMGPRPKQGHDHISHRILYQENVGWINGR